MLRARADSGPDLVGAAPALGASAAAGEGRPGLPVDPARLLHAIKRSRRAIAAAVLGAAVVGGVVGKILPKSYAAQATVLWQPAVEVKQETRVELATIADSVKLPSNLEKVAARVGAKGPVERLAKRVTVSLGDASMLVNVTATGDTREASADLANAMVDVFLESQRSVVRARRREITDALRASLVGAEQRTREARARYDAFRDSHGIGDLSLEMQGAIEEASHLRLARDEAEVELQSLRAKETGLRAIEQMSPESVVVSSAEQRPDIARLAQVEADLASARALHAPDHPTVRALTAEAGALRKRAASDPTFVTQRTMGRNAVRDAITVQAEESSALRRAIEEKSRTLDRVRAEADARTAKLTVAQGEAARRLADVEAAEQHVAALLRQIAAADDDVRGVSSGFQIVSAATPPEHSEKGVGRLVALALPIVALLVAVVVVLARELKGLRLRTGREVAFHAKLPITWTSAWPLPEAASSEGRELGRELARQLGPESRIVGVSYLGDARAAGGHVSRLVAERLRRQGKSVTNVDLCALARAATKEDLADALESPPVREAIETAADESDVLLAMLPSTADREAYRVAAGLVDAIVLVVQSGELDPLAARRLMHTVDVDPDRLRVVVVGVAPEILPPGPRGVARAAA